jgi:hypothetical protein
MLKRKLESEELYSLRYAPRIRLIKQRGRCGKQEYPTHMGQMGYVCCNVVGTLEGHIQFGGHRRRYENDIKINLTCVG